MNERLASARPSNIPTQLYTDTHTDRCIWYQKTHSASVTAGPNTYDVEKKPGQKIIDIDCRGLEFTEFKPDVRRTPLTLSYPLSSQILSSILMLIIDYYRGNGRQREPSPRHPSLVSISQKENGMITMRRQEKKLVLRISAGRSAGLESLK